MMRLLTLEFPKVTMTSSRPPVVFAALLVAGVLVLAPSLRAGQQPNDASLAAASNWTSRVPAHVARVDGAATLERDGRIDPLVENVPVLAGDRLRAARGRVDVAFDAGTLLDLDHDSSLDILSDSVFRLREGRVRLLVARAPTQVEYRIDAAPGSVFIDAPGDYRVEVSSAAGATELDVVVWHGLADVENPSGRTMVGAGTEADVVEGRAPSPAGPFNTAWTDEFDRWVEDARDARYGPESSRYLPDELQSYGGDLDRNGTWGSEPAYGDVWYPAVDATWQPYSTGEWSYVVPYGWWWVGAERWSWATHHYGRWGFASSRWFWAPDKRWSPGWVVWATAPSYVGWCPLGFDGKPVFGLGTDQFWRGWTVTTSRSFAPNVQVSRLAIGAEHLTTVARASLTVRSSPATSAAVATTPVRLAAGPSVTPATSMPHAPTPAVIPTPMSARPIGRTGEVSASSPPQRSAFEQRAAGFGSSNRSSSPSTRPPAPFESRVSPDRQPGPASSAPLDRRPPVRMPGPTIRDMWNASPQLPNRDAPIRPGQQTPPAAGDQRTPPPAASGRGDTAGHGSAAPAAPPGSGGRAGGRGRQ
jgi:hypothetical protein